MGGFGGSLVSGLGRKEARCTEGPPFFLNVLLLLCMCIPLWLLSSLVGPHGQGALSLFFLVLTYFFGIRFGRSGCLSPFFLFVFFILALV